MRKPKLHDIVFPLNFEVPKKNKRSREPTQIILIAENKSKSLVLYLAKKRKSLQTKLDASSSQTHQGIIKPLFPMG